jgi:hypothetical protein
MKEFIENLSENDDEKAWREVYVNYGKDYCAMIGGLMWSSSVKIPNFEKIPFHNELMRWTAWYKRSGKDPRQKREREILATVGLFEGESLLFPLIALKDFDSVKWLLDKEEMKKKTRKSSICSDETHER